MSLSDDHVHFSADGATEFLTRVGRSMSLKEARDYLSLPRRLERHLLDAGILVPFLQGAKGDIDHTFDRQDLDDLLARLVRNARPIADEDWKLVPVSKAATRACVSGVDVVKLLLDGRLATVRLDPGDRAFAAIRVDADEVMKVSKPERGGLSLKQAEKRMGASTSVVKALVDLSILPSRTLVNPVSRRIQRVVEEDDLDEFLRRYISVRNLALARSVHIGSVTARLRALGIAPAFDPNTVNATFFEQAQVKDITFP